MKKLQLIPLTLLSIALISLGWFLEVKYYKSGFNDIGNTDFTAITLGVALTLLLSALFIKKVFNTWKSKTLRTVILLFSAFITFSGQLSKYNDTVNSNSKKTAIEDNKQSLFEEYTLSVQTLKNTIQSKNDLLPKDLYGRAMINTNGVQPLLKEIATLTTNLQRYEQLKANLIPTLSTSENSKISNLSAYELLANDLGFNSPTPLKLVSQLLLSLFIALMAPSGITILQTVYPQAERVVVKEIKKEGRVGSNSGEQLPDTKKNTQCNTNTVTKDNVLMYLERWGNEENPTVLKSRSSVCNKTGLSVSVFNGITSRARKLGLISSSGNSAIPNVKKSEFLLMYKNNQSVRTLEMARG